MESGEMVRTAARNSAPSMPGVRGAAIDLQIGVLLHLATFLHQFCFRR
jgi:hypothetical protein